MHRTLRVSRRDFMIESAAGLAGLGLGCGGASNGAPVAPGSEPEDGGAGATGGGAGHDAARDGGASSDPACEPTREDILGPFFKPASPERRVLADATEPGERLRLVGRVLDAACQPLSDVILDFWQADSEGDYDQEGFHLRGHQHTDADGSYELSSIMPGHYLNGPQYRPAHLHLNVHVRGVLVLTTQLYFEDDPYNDIDPWFDTKRAIALEANQDGGLQGTFDLVLPA